MFRRGEKDTDDVAACESENIDVANVDDKQLVIPKLIGSHPTVTGTSPLFAGGLDTGGPGIWTQVLDT